MKGKVAQLDPSRRSRDRRAENAVLTPNFLRLNQGRPPGSARRDWAATSLAKRRRRQHRCSGEPCAPDSLQEGSPAMAPECEIPALWRWHRTSNADALALEDFRPALRRPLTTLCRRTAWQIRTNPDSGHALARCSANIRIAPLPLVAPLLRGDWSSPASANGGYIHRGGSRGRRRKDDPERMSPAPFQSWVAGLVEPISSATTQNTQPCARCSRGPRRSRTPARTARGEGPTCAP